MLTVIVVGVFLSKLWVIHNKKTTLPLLLQIIEFSASPFSEISAASIKLCVFKGKTAANPKLSFPVSVI